MTKSVKMNLNYLPKSSVDNINRANKLFGTDNEPTELMPLSLLRKRSITANDKLIMMTMYHNSNQSFRCLLSNGALAMLTGLDPKDVAKSLKNLAKHKMIIIRRAKVGNDVVRGIELVHKCSKDDVIQQIGGMISNANKR